MKSTILIPAFIVGVLVLSACSDNSPGTPDDVYEQNDDSASATSTVAGTNYAGILWDDDWYRIDVTSGFERVVANLGFAHANGDIDLELYDESGNLIDTATSTNDNERIDTTVSTAGTYYLRVFSANAPTGNSYTLNWILDDTYEPNDTRADSTPANANTDYSGVEFDDDWYRIDVTGGLERVVANLTFANDLGDIDLELYNDAGNVIATSTTNADNEHIDFDVGTPGTYYLRVFDFGNGTGNTYTLNWYGTVPPPADDQYEENDTKPSATALSVNTTINGVQLDDDWYQITVLPGSERVVADLTFTHASGDLDLELYNSASSVPLASSKSSTDNERIAIDVGTSGTYYLRVFNFSGASTANTYSLVWDAPADDLYEPNNNLASAHDLAVNTVISGIQLDDDWYSIDVMAASQNLSIDLVFSNASGDLDIELLDSGGGFIAGSFSADDNEHIDATVMSAGTYYLRVYDGTVVNGSTGNTYDLSWTGN